MTITYDAFYLTLQTPPAPTVPDGHGVPPSQPSVLATSGGEEPIPIQTSYLRISSSADICWFRL